MQEMDGYTLVTKVKVTRPWQICLLCSTSLSGVFNQAMVKRSGPTTLAKFSPDELAERVMEIIDQG